MNNYYRLFAIFLLLLITCRMNAQNITGRWETYRNQEFLQLNIEQRGNELCGYTYDYELNDRYSYCKANFTGRYDGQKKLWYFTGNSFIVNSGSHVLMRIMLWHEKSDAVNVLRGKIFLQMDNNSFDTEGDDVLVKKVADKPSKSPGQKACFPIRPKPSVSGVVPAKVMPSAAAKPIKAVVKTQQKVMPKPIKPAIIKAVKPVLVKAVKPEEPKKIILPVQTPVIETMARSPLQLKMISRKQVEQSRLIIHSKKLNLKLYDNGTVDGDSISVFYNGRLLASHQRLSEKPIELNISLDETTNVHEITMYAENLGSIPPNTALVIVTAGNKRYELRSKASLEENAVLVFEYKPE